MPGLYGFPTFKNGELKYRWFESFKDAQEAFAQLEQEGCQLVMGDLVEDNPNDKSNRENDCPQK